MEVDTFDRGDKLDYDKVEGKDADWNWEPDDDNDNGSSEVDDEEDELGEKSPKKGTCSDSGVTKRKLSKDKVKGPASQKRRSAYIKKGRYYKHIRTEDGKFKCRHCDQTFARLTSCNGHERAKHPKTPGGFVCEICSEAFDCRDYLRKHIKQRHEIGRRPTGKYRKVIMTENGKYQCQHCDQTFATRHVCLVHERTQHSETPGAFICDICGRAFNSASYLRGHQFQSHKLRADGTPIPRRDPKSLERDCICDKCGKGFKTTKLLQNHVRFVHEKRFLIKCALCGSGWPNSNSMKKHILAVHPEDPSTKKLVEEEGISLWQCPVIGCKVRFLKEASLKGHLKSKHGKEVEGPLEKGVVLEDPLIKETCQKCGKVCLNKGSLKQHEAVHENEGKEKEFFCEICGGGFVSREYLKMHVNRVHLKKGRGKGKEFKCDICGKGYGHRYLLKGHLEIHEREGKRDYFCDKCGHGFITEKHLRGHKRQTNCGVEGKQARVYNYKGEQNK